MWEVLLPVTKLIPGLVLDCMAMLPHLLKMLALPAASVFDNVMQVSRRGRR